VTESAEGRQPVDETRPSAPEQDTEGGPPVPTDSGVGMGLGKADTFEPEESAAEDADRE
jgi:hypothetical protein